jgi:hypothetical protein
VGGKQKHAYEEEAGGATQFKHKHHTQVEKSTADDYTAKKTRRGAGKEQRRESNPLKGEQQAPLQLRV